MRSAVQRLTFESDEVLVTAGGSTYFDLVADVPDREIGGGR